MRPRVLVACIGNIFFGDDGFGVEVAKRLATYHWPEHVRVVDYGIRGFDLTFALMDGYDVIIFVDAIQRGEASGTLYLIEPDLSELETVAAQPVAVEPHGMDPMKVLQMARSMGAEFKRILLVGCEPETFGPENEGLMGLSNTVESAIDEAVRMIESLIAETCGRE
ncbi:MAG: hydrogenase maturation protease [Acidobacteria bacterium]|nr:hydrogenase maturation protease [Acidobacteriota bacterium]